MTRTRNIILLVLVIFAVYWILTEPSDAADATNALWDLLVGGLQNIGTFFDELISN